VTNVEYTEFERLGITDTAQEGSKVRAVAVVVVVVVVRAVWLAAGMGCLLMVPVCRLP
jgi:hypothetical protein